MTAPARVLIFDREPARRSASTAAPVGTPTPWSGMVLSLRAELRVLAAALAAVQATLAANPKGN